VSGEIASVPSALEPLQKRTAADQIAERLVTAIALGEYVPGQRLPPERTFATLLGVSRKSLREALHALVEQGYLEITRGRSGGAVVRERWLPASEEMVRRTLGENWETLEALLDFRQLLEPLIARTAAERRQEDDLTRIETAVRAYETAAVREASRAADAEVHAAVADAARNPYLAGLSRNIREQVTLGFQAEPFTEGLRETAVEQHAELLEVIAAGDGDAAAQVARKHFLLTEHAVRELLRQVGSGT
jgi:DNA-binding FadR family transcriptional regulator